MIIDLNQLKFFLKEKLKNIEEPHKESYYILKYFFGLTEKDFIQNKTLDISFKKLKQLLLITKKRNLGMPFSYLFHKKEFYSMEFYVNSHVLIPRPETELLVELTLKEFQSLPMSLIGLDVGTGSGCIAISLIKHAKNLHRIIAIDIDKNALRVARINKYRLLNVEERKILKFLKLDFINEEFDFKQYFDFIVSNPPYVLEHEYFKLKKELFYEPQIALVVKEPETFYSTFFRKAYKILKVGGFMFLETSPTLINIQISILENLNIKHYKIFKDYQNQNRFLFIKKS